MAFNLIRLQEYIKDEIIKDNSEDLNWTEEEWKDLLERVERENYLNSLIDVNVDFKKSDEGIKYFLDSKEIDKDLLEQIIAKGGDLDTFKQKVKHMHHDSIQNKEALAILDQAITADLREALMNL